MKSGSQSRTCGECQECCTSVTVKPLNKPSGQLCQFQCATGCAIYADRPECCAIYTCSWISGDLPQPLRPDQCGMLFETVWVEKPRKVNFVIGWELRAGAWDELADTLEDYVRPGWVYANVTKDDVSVAFARKADFDIFLGAMADMANGRMLFKGADLTVPV